MNLRALLFCIVCTLALLQGQAMAADYPRTLTDVAGRQVVIPAEPQRILMQNNNDLISLTILDREDPLARVVAWHDSLKSSDPSLWKVLAQRWPEINAVPTLEFSSSGDVDTEAIIRAKPDLLIARLEVKPIVENSVLDEVLQRLNIPLLYVDAEMDPLRNIPRSLSLLGQALNRETRAAAYIDTYEQRLAALRQRIDGLPERQVFFEIRAGQAGSGCCYTVGKGSWAAMAQALGAVNMGSELLPGQSGDVALETLIRHKPDIYLMTGTPRLRDGVGGIALGYDASPEQIDATLQRLIDRPGFRRIRTEPDTCTHALYHQFYNSLFNIAGMEYLATIFWPEQFADLDPDTLYRELVSGFTDIPDAPFIFHSTTCG